MSTVIRRIRPGGREKDPPLPAIAPTMDTAAYFFFGSASWAGWMTRPGRSAATRGPSDRRRVGGQRELRLSAWWGCWWQLPAGFQQLVFDPQHEFFALASFALLTVPLRFVGAC